MGLFTRSRQRRLLDHLLGIIASGLRFVCWSFVLCASVGIPSAMGCVVLSLPFLLGRCPAPISFVITDVLFAWVRLLLFPFRRLHDATLSVLDSVWTPDERAHKLLNTLLCDELSCLIWDLFASYAFILLTAGLSAEIESFQQHNLFSRASDELLFRRRSVRVSAASSPLPLLPPEVSAPRTRTVDTACARSNLFLYLRSLKLIAPLSVPACISPALGTDLVEAALGRPPNGCSGLAMLLLHCLDENDAPHPSEDESQRR